MSSNTVHSPHAGHRARLKKRFARAPHHMEDYEVLELLLGYALLRKDTKPLAKDLLRRFGSVRGVLDARADELQSVDGFGPGLGQFFQLLREVQARYDEAPVRKREVLSTPEAVAQMARTRLTGNTHEECWIALVDTSNHCIAWERLVRGGIAQAPVEVREVIAMALHHKASGFILVHNHPGGNCKPSAPDLRITEMLQHMANGMGLRFLDHVIVTEKDCYSLTRHELL